MRTLIALAVLAVGAVVLIGCNCFSCNPCDPCVTAPVYKSPCCPAPAGGVDGSWGGGARSAPPAMGRGSSCGGCGGVGGCG
jgi:hypothetical protein